MGRARTEDVCPSACSVRWDDLHGVLPRYTPFAVNVNKNETAPKTAVLVTAHGTPDSLDELPEFLANIRGGRPAPDDLIAEVRHRYQVIGGRSPLGEIARAQARALEERMNIPVFVAMRLWRPFPREVILEMVARGIQRLISVPLAPYSVHVYHSAVEAALATIPRPPELVKIPPWNLAPALIQAFAEDIDRAVAATPTGVRVAVVLSAHSLPVRVIEAGDPYKTLVTETAQAVTAALTHAVPTRLAYQSQGKTAEPWLGPDLFTTLRELAREGFQHVVVCPIGFVADHIETLYDIDVEAQTMARRLGLGWSRTRTLNDTPALIDALASMVSAVLSKRSEEIQPRVRPRAV